MRESRGPVLELVEALAEHEGVDVHELEYSLHECVDSEAIKRLAAMETGSWTLTFEIPDGEMSIDGSGRIMIDGSVVRRVDFGEFNRIR